MLGLHTYVFDDELASFDVLSSKQAKSLGPRAELHTCSKAGNTVSVAMSAVVHAYAQGCLLCVKARLHILVYRHTASRSACACDDT